MIKEYGEVIVSDDLMEFIYYSFRPMFRLNNGYMKINQESMYDNIEWSAKIYHNIQGLIDRMAENYNQKKYVIVDGGSRLILIFPDKYDVRFVRIFINKDYKMEIKENIIYNNVKESYYNNLLFMHTKSVDNMLYDFAMA